MKLCFLGEGDGIFFICWKLFKFFKIAFLFVILACYLYMRDASDDGLGCRLFYLFGFVLAVVIAKLWVISTDTTTVSRVQVYVGWCSITCVCNSFRIQFSDQI